MCHTCKKCKMLHAAQKETGRRSALLEIISTPLGFPLTHVGSIVSGLGRGEEGGLDLSPEGDLRHVICLSLLCGRRWQRVIHGDLGNQVVESFICVFVGVCLCCLDSETVDFPFMCLNLTLKEAFPHIFFPSYFCYWKKHILFVPQFPLLFYLIVVFTVPDTFL